MTEMAQRIAFALLPIAGMLVFTVSARSQTEYMNPGFKVGYVFGELGGFIYGAEFSYTSIPSDGPMTGLVANIDFYRDRLRIHAGVEASVGYIGLDLGPTIVFEKSTPVLAFSFVPFTGLFLYPYYNYTVQFNGESVGELGTYLKFPYRADGGPLIDFD